MPQEILILPAGTYSLAGGGTRTVVALTVTPDAASIAVGAAATFTTNATAGATWAIRRNGTNVATGVVGTNAITASTVGYSSSDVMTCQVVSGAQTVTSSNMTLTSSALPLDSLTGIEFALSASRRLLTTYTGALIRVRRSSDNTEQDIGYTGANILDTAALLSFVGSGDGFIRTVYGQSNSRNFVQTTTTFQPRIVVSGVVQTLGGRPTMVFDGTDDRIEWAPSSTTLTVNTVNGVCLRSAAGTGTGRLFNLGNSGGGDAIIVQHASSGGGSGRTASKGGVGVGTGAWPTDTQQIVSITGQDSGNSRFYVNGAQNQAATAWGTGSTTTTQARIGSSVNPVGSYWNGPISEITAFSGSLSNSDRAALEANQAAFYV
jgi:hypothetical protein